MSVLVSVCVRWTVVGLVVLAVGSSLAMGSAARQATPSPEAGLPAVVWQLAEITAGDGTAMVPDDPTMYTLQFVSAERAAVRADCNVGGGAYTVAGDQVTIGPLATTLAACARGSLEGAYMQALEQVTSFSYEEDALVLTLDGEGDRCGSRRR